MLTARGMQTDGKSKTEKPRQRAKGTMAALDKRMKTFLGFKVTSLHNRIFP